MKRTICLAVLLAHAPHAPLRAEEVRIAVEAGVEINLVDEGPRSTEAMVFIPGWGMASSVWRKQVEHFAKTRRVLALDPRSQGKSSVTAGDVSPEARAKDIAAILDARGVERAILVGWSQGVQDIAAYVAAHGDSRVSGVVLVDALPSRGLEGAAEDKDLAQHLRFMNIYLTAPAAYAKGMVGAIFAQPLSADERARFEADVLRTPPAIGTSAMLSAFYGRDRRGAVEKLCVPVLVVAAAQSPTAREAPPYAASMRAGRYDIIEDAGHALFFDQPGAFNAALENFLLEADPAPACDS